MLRGVKGSNKNSFATSVRFGGARTELEGEKNNHLLCNAASYGKIPVSRLNAKVVTVYHPIASFLAHTCVYLVTLLNRYRKSIFVTCFQNNIFFSHFLAPMLSLKGPAARVDCIIINLYYWKSM